MVDVHGQVSPAASSDGAGTTTTANATHYDVATGGTPPARVAIRESLPATTATALDWNQRGGGPPNRVGDTAALADHPPPTVRRPLSTPTAAAPGRHLRRQFADSQPYSSTRLAIRKPLPAGLASAPSPLGVHHREVPRANASRQPHPALATTSQTVPTDAAPVDPPSDHDTPDPRLHRQEIPCQHRHGRQRHLQRHRHLRR